MFDYGEFDGTNSAKFVDKNGFRGLSGDYSNGYRKQLKWWAKDYFEKGVEKINIDRPPTKFQEMSERRLKYSEFT